MLPRISFKWIGLDGMVSGWGEVSLEQLTLLKRTCFLDKRSWAATKFLSLRGRYLCSEMCVILNGKHPHLLLESLLKLINLVLGKHNPPNLSHFS